MLREVMRVLAIGVLVAGIATPSAAGEGSIGIVDTTSGEWYLRDPSNGVTTRFFYGSPGDLPFVGDWDCDGDETPGLYRQSDGFVYLRNSNSQGVADISFYFGNPGDIPIAGDFDGDGCDSASIYRSSEGKVYVTNRLGSHGGGLGAADVSYFFGDPGDQPFVGDFDDDGIDEFGLRREATGLAYYRLTHTQGAADVEFVFGDPGDRMIAANWGSSGPESVGLFRPSICTTYLRQSNTQSAANETLLYGVRTGVPVAGDFGVLPGGGAPPDCPPCPPDPFNAARANSLELRYPGRLFTAHVFDTRTGCEFSMNPGARQPTASVFKVMVMAGALHEAQLAGRGVSGWEMSQLTPMITASANAPVRALWRHFGGSPWFSRQALSFGMDETNPVGDTESVWGRTTTSASDQVDLIRQVLLGHSGPIASAYREVAWALMTSVVPDQTWGITSGVPEGWVVAQKNGFAGGVANSVGFVQHPDGADGYVIAVLTTGWTSWAQGVATVNEISGWVSEAMTR